jgi:hypothetical protein
MKLFLVEDTSSSTSTYLSTGRLQDPVLKKRIGLQELVP